MIRDQLAVGLGHDGEHLEALLINLFQLDDICLSTDRPVLFRSDLGEMGGEEPGGIHILDRIEPEVRIEKPLIVLVGVRCFYEQTRVDVGSDVPNAYSIGCGSLEHVVEAFLKTEAVRNNEIGLLDGSDLLGRCLEVMRVHTDRHQDEDFALIADHVLGKVAQDRGRCNDTDASVVFLAGSAPAEAEQDNRCHCDSRYESLHAQPLAHNENDSYYQRTLSGGAW